MRAIATRKRYSVVRPRRRRGPTFPVRGHARRFPIETNTAAPRRTLAVVLITEVAGYGKLARENRKRAARLRARFEEIVKDAAAHHAGTVFDARGGTVRAVFRSPVLAVRAAADIQHQLRAIDETSSIAVHATDVVCNGSEPIGPGVELTRRMLTLATAGEILVSGAVAAELGRSRGTEARSLGRFILKGRDEPVEVSVVERVGGRKVNGSQLWSKDVALRARRGGMRLLAAAAVMSGATAVELAALVMPVPAWLMQGAAAMIVLELLAPLKSLRV